MAVVIDATPGGMSSNSYVTVEEATAYFNTRLGVTKWTGLTEDDKARALIMATIRLEQETWDFFKTNLGQQLAWPRYSAIDFEGNAISYTVIPSRIKEATFELALALLKGFTGSTSGLENFRNISIAGVIDVTPRSFTSDALPSNVIRLLRGFIIGGSGTVQLVRS